MLNELISTVVFEDETFVRRWKLACHENISHVVVMPKVIMWCTVLYSEILNAILLEIIRLI